MVKKKVTITLEEDSHLMIKELALKRRKTISELYEKILKDYIAKNKNQSILEEYETKGVKTEVESKKI